MTAPANHAETIAVTVELFGNARLVAGQESLRLDVSADATLGDLARALGRRRPQLVGKVVRDSLDGFLDSYTVNINGERFVSPGAVALSDGDALLVFSSQAGG